MFELGSAGKGRRFHALPGKRFFGSSKKGDLRDVPENVRREMTFHLANTVDEVLAATLPNPTPCFGERGWQQRRCCWPVGHHCWSDQGARGRE